MRINHIASFPYSTSKSPLKKRLRPHIRRNRLPVFTYCLIIQPVAELSQGFVQLIGIKRFAQMHVHPCL